MFVVAAPGMPGVSRFGQVVADSESIVMMSPPGQRLYLAFERVVQSLFVGLYSASFALTVGYYEWFSPLSSPRHRSHQQFSVPWQYLPYPSSSVQLKAVTSSRMSWYRCPAQSVGRYYLGQVGLAVAYHHQS